MWETWWDALETDSACGEIANAIVVVENRNKMEPTRVAPATAGSQAPVGVDGVLESERHVRIGIDGVNGGYMRRDFLPGDPVSFVRVALSVLALVQGPDVVLR